MIVGLLISNAIFIYLVAVLPDKHALAVEKVKNNHSNAILSIYTLSYLPSISKEKNTLEDRFEKAYKKFLTKARI